MELKLLTPQEYADSFDRYAPHVYNTVAFNEHNRHKAIRLHYVAFCTDRPCAGIIMGERDDMLLSPFSAPFGGLTALPKAVSAPTIEAAIEALRHYCRETGMKARITLPPAFYSPTLISAQSAALAHHGSLVWTDLNYHRDLCHISYDPVATFSRKARGAYNAALRHNLKLTLLDSADRADVDRLYRIIKENHLVLDHPLAMSAEEVWSTAPITHTRLLVMSHEDSDVAAAAINFPAPGIAQPCYWGDSMTGRSLHAMNLLAAEVMKRCREWGMHILDLGPSSKEGIIAPGLCRFKESIGCTATTKPTFVIEPGSGSEC